MDFFLIDLKSSEAIFIYLPPIVFKSAFCLDVHTFLRTLPQIMIISVPIALVTGCLTGFIMKYLIDPSWLLVTGLHIGILCLPTFVTHVIHRLRQLTTRTIHTINLLEGEALLNIGCVLIAHTIILGYRSDLIVHWYQYMAVTARIISFGIVIGYVHGFILRFLIRKTSTKPQTIVILMTAFPFLAFLNASLAGSSGTLSVVTFGILMAIERSTLSKQTEDLLNYMWRSLAAIVDVVVCLHVITTIITTEVLPTIHLKDYLLVFVAYIIYYIVRFISFMLFSPVLSRIGAGITFKNMVLVVWGGTKNPIGFMLVDRADYLFDVQYRKFIFYLAGIYFFSHLINGGLIATVLNVLGFTDISLARQVNMNNCMKHIFKKRAQTVAILKMDRFLSDADWSTVDNATALKHPYTIGIHSTDEEDEALMGYRYAYCSDCNLEVLEEPTPKQMKEMIREAKMRILKAKKMSYSRQYENEMMTHESIRILIHAVEIAMETEDAEIVLDGLHSRFNEESCFRRFLRKHMKHIPSHHDGQRRLPRTYWRRMCYHLMTRKKFDCFMYCVILLNTIPTGLNIWHSTLEHSHFELWLCYITIILDATFFLIYLTEFVIKILGYSWIRICQHGFGTYFKSIWNIVDFVVLVANCFDLALDFHTLTSSHEYVKEYDLNLALAVMRFIRLIRLIHFCRDLQPNLLRYLEMRVDSRMAFTYELGRSYVAGEEEVLEMLPYMIDHEVIREHIRQKIEADRLNIIRLLGLLQKDKPWISITVKTKQAIRTVLCSMKAAISELKVSGWIDDFEGRKLTNLMDELYKNVTVMKSVQPSAPKIIFREVEWMAGDEHVIDFLFENVTVKKFEPGDVVFEEGNVAEGIYIVVTGLLCIKYSPQKSVLNSLRDFGELPIVDYISCIQFHNSAVDFIVSGNCIGELSTLTRRPYNCKIIADIHTQVYVLSHGVIKRAMELNSDPISGLECRIWKSVSTRIALPLLMSTSTYESSPYQAKFALERAFVPDLAHIKMFVVNEAIENILLIEGIVADFHSRQIFTAPCCIPRTVHRLILSNNSLLNIPIDIETKLLIIPEPNWEDFEIILVGESTCEVIPVNSDTKCLHHVVQNRLLKTKKEQSRKDFRNHRRYAVDLTGKNLIKGNIPTALDTSQSSNSGDLSFYLHEDESDRKPKYASEPQIYFEKK
ncbi:unnamed protein product [Tenebrio molitor]|nr:unnamed protein product [Tenebrio molitor]